MIAAGLKTVVSDHAIERYRSRVWPTYREGNCGRNRITDRTIAKRLKHAYAIGEHVSGEIPQDIVPMMQRIRLEEHEFVRWCAEERVGMVCKNNEQERAVIIKTCFSARVVGEDIDKSGRTIRDKYFWACHKAIDDWRPWMDSQEKIALSSMVAKEVRGIEK